MQVIPQQELGEYMNEGFVINISIIDQWKSQNDTYRLVNLGAGPDTLQVLKNEEWVEETQCYVHSELCNRIKTLSKTMESI